MNDKNPSLIRALWKEQIWIFALVIIAGLGLATIKISDRNAATAFLKNGVEVIGEVTHLHDYTSGKTKKFNVSYAFASPNDPYIQSFQLVREEFFDTLTDGGPVRVWYMPDDPAKNVIDIGELTTLFWVAMLGSLVLIFTGIVAGHFAILRALAKVRSGGSDTSNNDGDK